MANIEQVEHQIEDASVRIEKFFETGGKILVTAFHLLALFTIGATIVWSAVYAYIHMMEKDHFTIEDILLLFIYLELGAMVGIYFYTKHMPVRFLIYVAITALTRMLIGYINVDHIPNEKILYIAGAIVLLALSLLMLRYGSFHYPSPPTDSQARQPIAGKES